MRAVVLAAFLVLPSRAVGQRSAWYVVWRDSTSEGAVDTSSIFRQGSTVAYWLRTNYKKATSFDPAEQPAVREDVRDQFDCAASALRSLQMIRYDVQGKILFSAVTDSTGRSVPSARYRVCCTQCSR